MLKWSNENDVNTFCAKICSLFNPKYTGSQAEKDAQAELDFATAYDFAKKCELTADEMILAFQLATEGRLKYEVDKDGNSEPIKLYREIDSIKLGELKSAYLRYKQQDKGYELGKEKLKELLNPIQELTEEEKKQVRLNWLKMEFERLQKDGFVHGTTEFFKIIQSKEEIKMNVADVVKVLGRFNPEKAVGKNAEGMPIVKKNDASTYFIDWFVAKYIVKHKLKELPLQDWINYWEKFVI